jgi:hypothetical protein
LSIGEIAQWLVNEITSPFGGWAVVVTALSVFLSKFWSDRTLQNERHKNERLLAEYKHLIEALERKNSLNYQQKIELYKAVSSPLAALVAQIESEGLTREHLDEFNLQRLNLTAQLALFASEEVFDSFNDLLDYIYDSLETNDYSFQEFRIHALSLLSKMRKDIGIYQEPVFYKGRR